MELMENKALSHHVQNLLQSLNLEQIFLQWTIQRNANGDKKFQVQKVWLVPKNYSIPLPRIQTNNHKAKNVHVFTQQQWTTDIQV